VSIIFRYFFSHGSGLPREEGVFVRVIMLINVITKFVEIDGGVLNPCSP